MARYRVQEDFELTINNTFSVSIPLQKGDILEHNDEFFGGIQGRNVSFTIRRKYLEGAIEQGLLKRID